METPASNPFSDPEGLVRSQGPWMLAVASRLVGPDQAQDVVQSAFIKALAKQDSFEGRANIKTWLHRIVVNEALMLIRKQKPEAELDTAFEETQSLMPRFDAWGNLVATTADTNSQTPETHLNDQQTSTIVGDQIGKLPKPLKAVLVLRDIEQMSTAEVADALQISAQNVKVRLHRARLALRSLLEPFHKQGLL